MVSLSRWLTCTCMESLCTSDGIVVGSNSCENSVMFNELAVMSEVSKHKRVRILEVVWDKVINAWLVVSYADYHEGVRMIEITWDDDGNSIVVERRLT